jgi:hypothetical protein
MNAQALKLPLASVVQGMPASAVTGTLLPPKIKPMVLCGAKPLPFIATLLPTGPTLGVRLMPRVIVKVALPEYVPSDAVTVWGPAVVTGTVNVQWLLASR